MNNIFAVFIGAIIAVMVSFNGTLASYAGDYFGVFITQVVALITISFVLIILKKKVKLKNTPLYLFLGGAIGVALTMFNNISVQHLGVSLSLSLGLLGQSIAAVIIDHFGLLGMKKYRFRKEKLIGFLLAFSGIAVMIIF